MSKTGEKVRELAKEIFNIGYEAGVKACNTDCAIVWEDRIDAIKADIERVSLIGGINQPIEYGLLMSIIDKHCGGDNE